MGASSFNTKMFLYQDKVCVSSSSDEKQNPVVLFKLSYKQKTSLNT